MNFRHSLYDPNLGPLITSYIDRSQHNLRIVFSEYGLRWVDEQVVYDDEEQGVLITLQRDTLLGRHELDNLLDDLDAVLDDRADDGIGMTRLPDGRAEFTYFVRL